MNTIHTQEEAKKIIDEQIVPLVNRFQKFQMPSGRVKPECVEEAKQTLLQLLPFTKEAYAQLGQSFIYEAFETDVTEWIGRGLAELPDFKNVRDVFPAPQNNEHSFFIGAVRNQNCPEPRGFFLECFFTFRHEPGACEILYEKYPHPKNICQSTQLITGSRGFVTGNCIVFFPENIIAGNKVVKQKYAIFFFSKFRKIYRESTMTVLNRILENPQEFEQAGLYHADKMEEGDMYDARCVWGYLHDYYHHQGKRPFDENISLKMNWFVGLLEELKTDCKTAIACLDDDFRFGKQVFQFILFDRMFRYPIQVDWFRNFDSGTGFFLFQWLHHHNAIQVNQEKGTITIVPGLLRDTIAKLVKAIEDIDELHSDEEIIEASKKLVQSFLSVSDTKKITSISREYRVIFDQFSLQDDKPVFNEKKFDPVQ